MKKPLSLSFYPETHDELAALAKRSRMTKNGWLEQQIRVQYGIMRAHEIDSDFGPGVENPPRGKKADDDPLDR